MKKACLIITLALMVLSVRAEVITDIVIVNQAGETYDISSVSAFTSFKVGEQVPDRETILSSIAVDVNRMRESERFSYVDARMDVTGDGVVLVYTVVAKHRLQRIEILDSEKMSNRKVLRKSELSIGQFADDTTFELAASKIKEAYNDFWYPDAKVEWVAETNEKLGTVDVTFQIDEGLKLAIKRIVFEGNDLIDDDKLKKIIQQKQKRWYSFITGSGKYKEETTDSDVFAIKSFYMNNGFLDVQVAEPELDASKPKKAILIYRIDEGQRYRIGEITLSGMEELSEDALAPTIRLRPGNIASYENINNGSEGLRAYYGNRGYIRASVDPEFNANADTGTVDIEYAITEGSVGYINKVNISGNERTKDKVIRREVVIYPNEIYNRSRVKTSENRLRNLNYFEIVTINTEYTGEGDRYDLNVQVNEKPTGQFSAGVGFSSVDALVGYVELSQGNFNYKTWPPIGAGQKFKIRAQLGTERNDLDISFIEPWFMDRQLSFGVDLFHREARYYSDSYDQSTDGFTLSLGKPLSRFTRGTLAYSFERFDVYDISPTASQVIKDEAGTRTQSGLEYAWTYDSRDRPFNPTRGTMTIVTPYMAGGPLGGQTDIFGARVRSGKYWPLIGDMVFNLRGQVESVEAFGDSKEDPGVYGGRGVPLFSRLFLGGSYNLRGYEYRDVGPQNDGDPIGGNTSAYATGELNFPIWGKVRGAVFYDWGFVNVDSWDFNPSLYNDDWGIGLRFDLPGFPLHLDYAWPITYNEAVQAGDGRFNFLIGHTF